MSMRSVLSSLVALFTACGGVELAEPSSPSTEARTKEEALYGQLSGAEFAVDAPWRVEPEVVPCTGKCFPGTTTYRYAPIPLSVVIRDAYQSGLEHYRVESITIDEQGSGLAPQTIALSGFHELERTVGTWSQSQSITYNGPTHALCRIWRGDNCSGIEALTDSSEWDGSVMYPLRQPNTPGKRVRLKLTVTLRASLSSLPATRVFSNTVFVTLGYPIPRFDARWAYGDLHYHSQGTDNEGESGYSHRATLQALSALGFDFTFATEHASNSGQFDNYSDATPLGSRILRDMSSRRWAALLDGLNGVSGANDEVTKMPRKRGSTTLSVPQLFLGGEVDVIPEVGASDYFANRVRFGNHVAYFFLDACTSYPGWETVSACPTLTRTDLSTPAWDTETGAAIPNRWFLEDVQGPLDRLFARQHLLHLPDNGNDLSAFVPSNTTVWGGASRRLATLLRQEYAQATKGISFLAHPVDYASGADADRLGPDIIPYSAEQLDDAFRNTSVLGLQLWNEDIRLRDSSVAESDLVPLWEVNSGPLFGALYHGLATFDRMLLWSVDPTRTQTVAGLAPGQIRKVFLAGGSDAHGDLNYARKGYAFGLSTVKDLAIGKPRNLVMVPARHGRTLSGAGLTTQAVSQTDVTNGLRSGQFIVTDGPLVRIAIDVNGNGVIDDADVPMGSEGKWSPLVPTLPVIVQWQSTPEFGRITMVDLTVNAFTASTGLGLSYAPVQNGVRSPTQPIGWFKNTYWGAGTPFYELDDHYFYDPSGLLRIAVPAAEGYSGRRVLNLDPNLFKTAQVYSTSAPCEVCSNPTDFAQKQGTTPIDPLGTCQNTCTLQGALNVQPPSALVIRAMARTNGVGDLDPNTNRVMCDASQGDCEPRLAFTNPVWARFANETLSFSQ